MTKWGNSHPDIKSSVLAVWVNVVRPKFRNKAIDPSKILNVDMESMKFQIRTKYKTKVVNYIHDVVVHAGDNSVHTQHIEKVLQLHHSWESKKQCGVERSPRISYSAALIDQLLETRMVLRREHVPFDDASIVGSVAFSLGGVDMGRPNDDIDVSFSDAVRISRYPSSGPMRLSNSTHLISRHWFPGSINDTEIVHNPRYFHKVLNDTLKVVRPELVYIKKCTGHRPKDLVDVRHLHNTSTSVWDLRLLDHLKGAIRGQPHQLAKSCPLLAKRGHAHSAEPTRPSFNSFKLE